MNGLLQDLRYAVRQLRKSPGFAVTAVLSLTLGIGATTAIFSVVYSILLDPYPYRDADRMVHVELRDKGDRGPLLVVNGSEYPELRRASSVDDVFLQNQQMQTLTGGQFPISVNVGQYSPNLFAYMGVPLLLGRGFTSADAPGGKGSPVAVLSYLFWQRQFAGNRGVVGQSIELNHKLYTIIGVVPSRFTWGDSDVYLPALPSGDPHDYWMSFIKLKPGVKHPAAAAELQLLVDRFTKEDPKDFRRDRRVAIVTLNEEVLGRFSGTLVLLFVAVIALLVIGCSNVSILLLARGIARQHELAVRASIGASRTRLIRQLLTESVLLSAVGAALGVLLAYRAVGTLSSMLPLYSFPHEAAIRVNGPVLAFSAAVAVITGILFGISPAWQLSHPPISELIQANSTKHSGSSRSRSTHRLLIAGQVSLTLLLMAGAGAAMKAFLALTHTPLGFDPDHVLALNTAIPKGTNTTWQARLNTNEAIRQSIAEVPGVTSASVSTTWFPPFGGFNAKIEIRSKPTLTGAEAVLALVSPQEFTTLRIPLLAGRIFDDAELNRAAHVALVNQAFVKQFLPEGNPLGQNVRSPMLKAEFPDLLLAQAPDDWLEIIGVVGDARDDGLERPVKPAVFLPYSFVLPPDVALLVRAKGNPEAAIRSVKQRLRELNPELVVNQEHTLAWWLETQGWGQGRFIATLFSLFAILALALAGTGLYSVVSFSVTQRTQEVGIRMALGAPRANILRLVISSTALMLAAGVAVGLGLSLALDHIVRAWAGGSPRDPLTLLVSALILILVATIACVVPAWRAATVDPSVALRYE
ncbi:MAG: ABC transporter permease [Acidobacteriia bacterium]|nr:ABC transporter permease [Terriglobia bacterium]